MICPECSTEMELIQEPLHDHYKCPWCELELPLDYIEDLEIGDDEDENSNS